MIRLVLTPSAAQPRNRTRRYDAVREDTGELVCASHQPLYDGARALLAAGLEPATLLTLRHRHLPHDSFVPAPLAELARWTCVEGSRTRLGRGPWHPDRRDHGENSHETASPSD